MINHIVCATDFSDFSQNATTYALHLAKDINARITLTHISQPQAFLAHSPGDMMEQIWKEHEAEVRKRMQHQLDGILEKAPDLKAVTVDIEIRSGLVVDGIKIVADELKADLIIAGSHGRSGLKDLFFGNHTSGIISRADQPVLVIPVGANYQKPQKIGYGVDFTDFDKEDMQTLLELKEELKAGLEIVHVDVEHGDATEEQVSNFRQLVSHLMGEEQVHYEFLEGGEPMVELCNYAETGAVQILAIRHHHRNFLGQLIGKSVTQKLVDISPVPLLIFEE